MPSETPTAVCAPPAHEPIGFNNLLSQVSSKIQFHSHASRDQTKQKLFFQHTLTCFSQLLRMRCVTDIEYL